VSLEADGRRKRAASRPWDDQPVTPSGKSRDRPDWGSWVWVVVGTLLVASFVLLVVRQRRLSDYAAALGYFTVFAGAIRMPAFWTSRFPPRMASMLKKGFAISFIALAFAGIWSFNWVRAGRVTLDLAGVLVLVLLLAVMRRPRQSAG
jgi:hypothetical protein